jgi:hypothetical protein
MQISPREASQIQSAYENLYGERLTDYKLLISIHKQRKENEKRRGNTTRPLEGRTASS